MGLEGRYDVIEEFNTITKKTQWSIGKWICIPNKDRQPDLVSVGVDKVEVRSGGEVIDLYRKDLHPNRLLYKFHNAAASEVKARNVYVDNERVYRAWVRKTEI